MEQQNEYSTYQALTQEQWEEEATLAFIALHEHDEYGRLAIEADYYEKECNYLVA